MVVIKVIKHFSQLNHAKNFDNSYTKLNFHNLKKWFYQLSFYLFGTQHEKMQQKIEIMSQIFKRT